MFYFFQKLPEKYYFIENCRSEYLQRNALPKSTSRGTAAGIPVDCTWRCMDHDLICHRVVLAANSQFLREMLLRLLRTILKSSLATTRLRLVSASDDMSPKQTLKLKAQEWWSMDNALTHLGCVYKLTKLIFIYFTALLFVNIIILYIFVYSCSF